jgi:hypothetical protein
MTTFSDLINDTIDELAQVAGAGVQRYAEDLIASKLITTFDMVFDQLWWGGYMEWYQRTLDGTDGVVTTALTGVNKFDDVRAVFIGNSDVQLTITSSTINPFIITGTTPRFIEELSEDTPDKIIQFWPKTATGTVVVHARKHPVTFNPADTVKIDRTLMKLGAAWQYLEDDGTNPGASEKEHNMFETRLSQLIKRHNSQPIILDPLTSVLPEEWTVL